MASASRSGLTGWQTAAAILVGIEVPLWFASLMIFIGAGVDGAIALLVVGLLMGLSLLTIFLFIKSVDAAVTIGLVLQGLLGLYGLVCTFALNPFVGIVDVPVAIAAAICIGQAAASTVKR